MQSAAASSNQMSMSRPALSSAVGLQTEEQDILLKVDLSGLELPKVNDLHVDGLQRSWWGRLFGK